jgi:hypothetical protein
MDRASRRRADRHRSAFVAYVMPAPVWLLAQLQATIRRGTIS